MVATSQCEPDVFGAISHPARRRMLDLLTEAERSVSDIAGHFAMSRPAVSQHLRVLLDAGLVTEQRHGRERRYRLIPAQLIPNRLEFSWFGGRGTLASRVQRLERQECLAHQARTIKTIRYKWSVSELLPRFPACALASSFLRSSSKSLGVHFQTHGWGCWWVRASDRRRRCSTAAPVAKSFGGRTFRWISEPSIAT